jgi:hypothetical protein
MAARRVTSADVAARRATAAAVAVAGRIVARGRRG